MNNGAAVLHKAPANIELTRRSFDTRLDGKIVNYSFRHFYSAGKEHVKVFCFVLDRPILNCQFKRKN